MIDGNYFERHDGAMTLKQTLLELAERCEAAKGPDRELDREIAHATNTLGTWMPGMGVTYSIDAALTLVPEGWEGRIEWRLSKGMHPAYASLWKPGASDTQFHANAHGKERALAICAAALRARAA